MSRPAVSSSKTRRCRADGRRPFRAIGAPDLQRQPASRAQTGSATVAGAGDRIDLDGATVIVIDLDATRDDEMQALERLTIDGGWPPVVVVTQDFDAMLRVRCCRCGSPTFWSAGLAGRTGSHLRARRETPWPASGKEAEIFAFLPAVGGVRRDDAFDSDRAAVAVERPARSQTSTCLVDLNLQHGACADYLDLEPRLDTRRNRTASGPPRQATARGDDVLSRLWPCGDRGAATGRPRCAPSIPTSSPSCSILFLRISNMS